MPLYELFCPLYMLLGACPRRGDCGYCCGGLWNASAEDGRECSIEMVLEDCIGGGNTSAIGSAVVADAGVWMLGREVRGRLWLGTRIKYVCSTRLAVSMWTL